MAINPNILNQINRRKELFGAKTKKPKKNLKWLHPDSVEVYYRNELLKFVRFMESETRKIVLPNLEGLIKEANSKITDRADSWVDSANVMLSSLKLSIEKNSPIDPLPLSQEVGARTSKWNNNQWRKIMKGTLGVVIYSRETWLDDQLKSFTAQNVALIQSLEDDTLKNIEGTIQRGIQSGASHKNISKELFGIDKGVFKKSKTRAKLIARDQVAKFNGNLTRLRQTDIGIDSYIWRTSEDERVRTTHKAHDGKTIQWSKPPAVTGHVGQDYQCRCWADPIFPEEYFNEKGSKKETETKKKKETSERTIIGKTKSKNGDSVPAYFLRDKEFQKFSENYYEDTYEHLIIKDKKGKIIFQGDGSKNQVIIPNDIVKFSSGGKSVHNHPLSNSFSTEDISTLVRLNQKEMYVVSKKYMYKMELVEGVSEKERLVYGKKLSRYIKREDDKLKKSWWKKINSGEMSKAYAQENHFHELMRKITFTPIMGANIKYSRTAIKGVEYVTK